MAIIKFTEEEAAAMNEAMTQDSRRERREAIALFKQDPAAAKTKYPFFEDLFKRITDQTMK